MAALRGEVPVEGTDLILTFDVNALCLAEMALGKTTDEIVEDFDAMRQAAAAKVRGALNLQLLRALFWAGLQKHRDCSIEEAAGLMPLPITNAFDAIVAGMMAAFGAAEGKDAADPPTTTESGSTG